MEAHKTTRLYTEAQIHKLHDEAWEEAEGDIIRALKHATDGNTQRDLIAQLRNLTQARGRVNVRIG